MRVDNFYIALKTPRSRVACSAVVHIVSEFTSVLMCESSHLFWTPVYTFRHTFCFCIIIRTALAHQPGGHATNRKVNTAQDFS